MADDAMQANIKLVIATLRDQGYPAMAQVVERFVEQVHDDADAAGRRADAEEDAALIKEAATLLRDWVNPPKFSPDEKGLDLTAARFSSLSARTRSWLARYDG
jgi:hypothetical protein